MENTDSKKLPTIAITAGDINGVGYEILLKTLAEPHIQELCHPVVYGNAVVAKAHAATLDEAYRDVKLDIVSCYPDNTPLNLGQSTVAAGLASFAALDRACKDLKAGKVDALVTCPINKENIQSEQFHFSGHTEYLTEQFSTNHESLMMMVSEMMRVALVCNHTPLAKVPQMISEDRILRKLRVLKSTLERDFTIRAPRIAVLALNPHAGDNGLIGAEEQTIIRPAIEKANAEGIQAYGPYPADGFFGAGSYIHYDAVLAMYHDQGLIGFKTLDMSGVNYTAGLNIVRTSPDHGTAYDLAGKNMASPQSFFHALCLACDVLKRRALHDEINANPLKIEPKEQREYDSKRDTPFVPGVHEE